ncbi:hypothetical protein VDGD_20816 [Verticillium dahliae]|nr:hypothetical protein VDGD_20816 [Verticillium dahliae]
MAPSSKTNFKTYEAQARLVRAMIAAHPEVKWNYKGTYYEPSLCSFSSYHAFPADRLSDVRQ